MSVPVLPESAPFNPSQRAWLNGFFAGVYGAGEDDTGTIVAPAMAMTNVDLQPPAVEAEEEMPWHDPALPMADRLQLAEGKPPARVLMAAMAQLDCGACGFLCQTYSEAIAAGTEKSLTLCSPGGKETSKKLKELITSLPMGEVTVKGKPVAEPAKPVVGKQKYDRTNPFPARLLKVVRLNGAGSDKDVRQIVLDLKGSGITYNVGDALGVFPENCPDLVQSLLESLAASGAEDVHANDGTHTSLHDALTRDYSITRPSEDLLRLLSRHCTDPLDAEVLREMLADDGAIETALDGREILDLLMQFPSAKPPADEFVATLSPLQPRLYSISSSLKAHPEEVHLTVGVVRYTGKTGRAARGVASCYLSERVRPGQKVRVFAQPSHRFAIPADHATPMIMVGPGTGIAPFRAFLEERKALGATGKNWLFFGDQKAAGDFLYREELEAYQSSGVLTRLDTAFSRDQKEKIYVQHRMIEHGAELWNWLQAGGCFYVCGDAKRMAVDVDMALHKVIAEHGGMTPEKASAYIAEMSKNKRYLRDVY